MAPYRGETNIVEYLNGFVYLLFIFQFRLRVSVFTHCIMRNFEKYNWEQPLDFLTWDRNIWSRSAEIVYNCSRKKKTVFQKICTMTRLWNFSDYLISRRIRDIFWIFSCVYPFTFISILNERDFHHSIFLQNTHILINFISASIRYGQTFSIYASTYQIVDFIHLKYVDSSSLPESCIEYFIDESTILI